MPHIDKIVIFHDDFYLSRDDAFKNFKRKIQIKALFSFSKIFCVSEYSKDSLIRLGIKDKNLAVINQGIDTNIYFPPKTDKRPIQDKYIISMGSNRARKNFAYIFKAFALLKDKYKNLKLIIIGAEQHSKDTINILQFFDNIPHLKGEVLVKGFIDKSELSHYIANAELLLFPSLKEGFGLPIIEAQACGTPVISRPCKIATV